MRELKFRIWGKTEKEYIRYPFAWLSIFDSPDGLEIEDNEDLVIEQYTGLKDKNGKEIYEGDIVEINGWWNAAGPAGYSENLCAVKWDEEITGFVPFNDYDCDCGVYHHAKDCEVIGNIHENPELLGEEKE